MNEVNVTFQVPQRLADILQTIVKIMENPDQDYRPSAHHLESYHYDTDPVKRTRNHTVSVAETMRARTFVLREPVQRTIRKYHPTSEDINALEKFDHLIADHRIILDGNDDYTLPAMLWAIMDLPLTDEDGNTDWLTWWTHTSALSRDIDVLSYRNRGPTHQAHEAPARILTSVIAAGIPQLPAVRDIGRHLTNRGRTQTGSYEPKKNDVAAVRLTDVAIETARMYHLAKTAGDPPPPLTDPRELEHLLNEAGIQYLRDMGLIAPPIEMRDDATWRDEDLYINVDRRLWWRRGTGWEMHNAFSDHGGCHVYKASHMTPQELLMERTAPPDPRKTGDIYTAMGWINGMTPNDARGIVAGTADEPGQPPPMCPMTEHCDSACSQLQREGHVPYPVNDTGNYEDCRYYHFLARARLQDSPSVVDALARRELDKLQQRRTRKDQNRRDVDIPRNPQVPKNREVPDSPAVIAREETTQTQFSLFDA